MRKTVEFAAEDGTFLRANLHTPASLPAPVIVMAHGFSGVRDQIDHYAAAFAEAGFLTLCFDHRGFGTSDGLPRQEVDPFQQLEDWRDAITFILSLPGADGAPGVGVWGSSFGGGLAIALAAIDARVGCVVAQIPNVSGPRNTKQVYDVGTRARIRALCDADRRGRLAGEEPVRVPVMTSDPDAICALPPHVSPRYIAAAESAFPTWVNEVTIRSIENSMWYEPAAHVAYVSPTPLMMIVGRNDTCTFPDLQLEIYEQARQPKRLLIHPGGHFDTYTDHFEATSTGALEWFAAHLRPGVPNPANNSDRSRSNAHV